MRDDPHIRIAAGETTAQIWLVMASVNTAVQKVRDHRDVARHAELGDGRRAQAVRYRRHAIGLIDRERDDL